METRENGNKRNPQKSGGEDPSKNNLESKEIMTIFISLSPLLFSPYPNPIPKANS